MSNRVQLYAQIYVSLSCIGLSRNIPILICVSGKKVYWMLFILSWCLYHWVLINSNGQRHATRNMIIHNRKETVCNKDGYVRRKRVFPGILLLPGNYVHTLIYILHLNSFRLFVYLFISSAIVRHTYNIECREHLR